MSGLDSYTVKDLARIADLIKYGRAFEGGHAIGGVSVSCVCGVSLEDDDWLKVIAALSDMAGVYRPELSGMSSCTKHGHFYQEGCESCALANSVNAAIHTPTATPIR